MSEIVEIGKDTVNLTVVDNNITLGVTTSQVTLSAASVGPQGIPGATGATGPANVLSVGSVTSGATAAASITGTTPEQVLNLVIPSGSGGTYTYTQGTPASVWNITHNLGYRPQVSVIDSANSLVEGDIAYPTVDTMILTFSSAFSGVAYLS
jgi:hypothetical protein